MRSIPSEIIATMRIKKIYFDQILSGDKKIEYREAKDFYFKLFFRYSSTPKYLRLHYQTERQMLVELNGLSLFVGDDERYYFALYLGEAKLISVKEIIS